MPNIKRGAKETANLLGVSPDIVFKTIVFKRLHKGKTILAIVPGSKSVHPKLLAKALNEKKVVSCTQQEAEKITKLQAGGISPLALISKGFDMVLDKSAFDHEYIHISGAELGPNIRLSPKDLVALTNAKVAEISN